MIIGVIVISILVLIVLFLMAREGTKKGMETLQPAVAETTARVKQDTCLPDSLAPTAGCRLEAGAEGEERPTLALREAPHTKRLIPESCGTLGA